MESPPYLIEALSIMATSMFPRLFALIAAILPARPAPTMRKSVSIISSAICSNLKGMSLGLPAD
jgi:hypothetical protein